MLCLYIISLTTIMEQVREVSDLPLLTMDEHTRKTRCHTSCISIFVLYVKIIFPSCCQIQDVNYIAYIYIEVNLKWQWYKLHSITKSYKHVVKTSHFNFVVHIIHDGNSNFNGAI